MRYATLATLAGVLLLGAATTGCTKTLAPADVYTVLAEEGVRLPLHLRVISDIEDKNLSVASADDILPLFKRGENEEFTVWIHGEKQYKLWLQEFARGGIATNLWDEEVAFDSSSEHTVFVLELFPRPKAEKK